MLSNRGVVYRSLDYGFKWENVTETLIYKYGLEDAYRLKDISQSPADSKVIYLQGS